MSSVAVVAPLLLTAGAYPIALDLVASHVAWGATNRLFRRQCPAWLTPALIEAAGYQRVPTRPGCRDFVFEKAGLGGVSFGVKVTFIGEFRQVAGHGGHLVNYSQHHGAQSDFAATLAAFEQVTHFMRKVAA